MRRFVNTSDLRQGDIVYANINDGNGSVKQRPGVVVTPTEDIQAGDPVAVAAITKSIPNPVPPAKIVLPYCPNNSSRTRLTVRCAAVADWISDVVGDEVETKGGYVPEKLMRQIIEQISRA